MESAANQSMDITVNKINEWVRIDRQRKIRTDRRSRFFGHVRGIFVYLFFATILVFAFNHRVKIQDIAYAKVGGAMKHSVTSDKLRQGAVNYENQVDEITK
jgi:hypothetical protein